jgi:ABC-type amino acid transport substrate-binding protein
MSLNHSNSRPIRVALVIALAIAWMPGAVAGTMDRIRKDKTIRIAYRADAPPFSFTTAGTEPEGFMVDLCRAVADKLSAEEALPNLSVVFVPVTAANRFDAIRQDRADLLCEATSATLSRRELVDFSLPTFISGASLLIRSDGPRSLQALSGRKIGVLAGTTTEEALRNTLKDSGIAAEVITAKTHGEGIALLDEGRISAYFADRAILQILVKQSQSSLELADNYLTVEPYALALPHGDEDFRLAVDRALSHIYRDGEIEGIFARAFGEQAKPTTLLKSLYVISGLPD